MFRADSTRFSGAMLSASSGALAGISPAGSDEPDVGFGALMRELDGEIRTFIAQGSGDDSDFTLSVDARAWLQRQRQGSDLASVVDADGIHSVSPRLSESQQAFVDSVRPWANAAAQRLGVSPDIIAAQAALETGWGARPIRGADGSDSHNLFSIKAGPGWKGETTEIMTTEFEGGIAVKRREKFRSYADKGEAFSDFARLIASNPRYQSALNAGGDVRAYAQALARGGYATDPAYVDKLVRVSAQIGKD